MKRTELINRLIKEGFTEKTLASLTDNQIKLLSKKVLFESESTLTIKQDDVKKIEPSNLVNKTVRIVPESEISEYKKKKYVKEEGDIDQSESEMKDLSEKEFKILKSSLFKDKSKFKTLKKRSIKEGIEKNEVKNWVETLVENEYYSITTKNEISDLIQKKLMEQRLSEPDVDTPVKKPVTRPSEPTKDPSKRPFKEPWKTPTPGPDPRPKMKTTKLPEFLMFNNFSNKV